MILLASILLSLLFPFQDQGITDASQSGPEPERREKLPPLGSPQEEMFAKHAIERDEKKHKKLLDEASEGAKLGRELADNIRERGRLSDLELKSLQRIEKITRRIRDAAGAKDPDEAEITPSNLKDAVERLSELTATQRDELEKSSRHVISANLIHTSNKTLNLIKFIKNVLH
jgi:hypothetical protein